MAVLPEVVLGTLRYREVPTLIPNTYPTGGVIAHLWLPRANEKINVRTGVMFSRLQLDDGNRSFFRFPLQLEYLRPSGVFRPRFAYGPVFNNLTASTVSATAGGMSQFGDRFFVSLTYEIEFEQALVFAPEKFLGQGAFLGCAIRL